MNGLFEKYDVAGPRYTSYPTVPYWEAPPSSAEWFEGLSRFLAQPETSWSLYVHLPFCELRCWFCACNAIGTKDHAKEEAYISGVLAELDIYLKTTPGLREAPLRQIHLGGGTPTFFSAQSLDRLLTPVAENFSINPQQFDGSVEVNPNFTKEDQLQVFARHGFRRISFGVQDFDPQVQEAIHRKQSVEQTKALVDLSRSLGFDSVNFDLIYGLPYQSAQTVLETAKKTICLRPDRIALYSFALVPWIQPAHKKLADSAPHGAEKRELYEIYRSEFLAAGYVEIGMDHFALPSDRLAQSVGSGKLHRNFMGYTDCKSDLLLGVGVSAISESPDSYRQNVKEVPPYLEAIRRGELPTTRGHVKTEEDRRQQRQILNLMTSFEVDFSDGQQEQDVREFLAPMLADHLVDISNGQLRLTAAGRPFLRNACMAFDARMRRKQPQTRIFSQTV